MERIAQLMYLYPDQQEEYKKRHDELWPELEAALKAHGASNYSIFLDKNTDILFAYLEVESQARYNQIADTDICKKWWAYMAPIMKTNEDNSPVTKELHEVFYLA
ncbi:L-rhamnose mutarotase [Listeria fleischmannii]|jgi:L-rhamnose mutarotase|uniref:L-rhamnose mutarotase n=2 Tax=Listeria fleischmannii TaxID=1069827 RepID=W7DRM1_9LIST|nr:L-rhamnose mutarotase [Listeria fleischmannii]EIA21237.1 L-rhamnose mutarotase [Listeria fleischmannii subsp. coloradonensis]EUJ52943.1 L-rhamnose 1-epimerase [Listeria fleischmannii FSL S10-1203]MBC1398024.1 L-rhamnose mutarotase [Listeria fleischmannii]MBC1417864.1 L-rhamnose mutarotase [Listeria fleischmannii]MBC1426085.1 L-rhamnose mutarotase [Listeria fleischmannii]